MHTMHYTLIALEYNELHCLTVKTFHFTSCQSNKQHIILTEFNH